MLYLQASSQKDFVMLTNKCTVHNIMLKELLTYLTSMESVETHMHFNVSLVRIRSDEDDDHLATWL